MSRKRATNDSSSVELFPFLAVLLCTMGALIVVLVIIARQARAGAEQAAKAEMARAADDEKLQQENLQWRIEQLQTSREKTTQDLERDRLTLSHLEDHLRRLREEMETLLAAAKMLKQTAAHENGQRDQTAAELAELQRRIAEESRLLEEARRKAASSQPSYAIIPYEGPNKTSRRPIYIECRSDRVVLQPEAVVLLSGDFDGPLGPGNPLASALRATREHLAANQPVDHGEPYPLLLVRPDGIAAYYKVREAIESWGSDFGYELIGEDWNLEFPRPDERLAEVERRAVAEGRRYQERLAMAAPSKYGRRGETYRASPYRGGFVREASSRAGEDNGGSRGIAGTRNRSGGTESGAAINRMAGGNSTGPKTQAAGSSAAPASRDKPLGSPPQPGNTAQQQGTGGPNAAGSPGPGSPHSGQAGFGLSSVAETRGSNWALPESSKRAVPIQRPVRVMCCGDRLVILSEDGRLALRSVPLQDRTEETLDQFVSAIWTHIERWGIAGNGMYWRPILNLQVGPQGAPRAQDLKVLLEGSGLEVQDDKLGQR